MLLIYGTRLYVSFGWGGFVDGRGRYGMHERGLLMANVSEWGFCEMIFLHFVSLWLKFDGAVIIFFFEIFIDDISRRCCVEKMRIQCFSMIWWRCVMGNNAEITPNYRLLREPNITRNEPKASNCTSGWVAGNHRSLVGQIWNLNATRAPNETLRVN